MIKAVFFDMDNTLIENQVYYDLAEKKLCDYLENFGVRRAETKDVFMATDKELFKSHGYGSARMPAAFEATLKHFVPNADAEMVATVRGFAGEVFDTIAAVKAGVSEAIDMLAAAGLRLFIVTAGPSDVQEGRISRLPFKDKFEKNYVVPRKDKALFEMILAETGVKADEAVMVGDSLKSDIIPSVAAGMQAIWIEANNSFHEDAAGAPSHSTYKYDSLLNAMKHLVKYGTPDPKASSKSNAPKHNGPKPV